MSWLTRHRIPRRAGERWYWQDLLARLGLPGIAVRDVIRVNGGYQLYCRTGRAVRRRRPVTTAELSDLARRISVHKRLPRGAVYVEDELAGPGADFIIHVRQLPLAAAAGTG